MRYLSKRIAGAAGLVILICALAATPSTSYGQNAHGDGVGGIVIGDCGNLQVPAGNQLAQRLYAQGVQIYKWDGNAWVFIAPDAVLYPEVNSFDEVGIHYAGPTWQSNGGSKVVGRVLQRCTPDATAIPWLLLEAIYNQGPGVFGRTTYIQRINTTGGLAPLYRGTSVGEEARIQYTAEYLFFRAVR